MNNFFQMLLVNALGFNLFSSTYTVPDNRIHTVLIDTGLNITQKNVAYLCRENHHDLTDTGIADNYGHGDIMFKLITNKIDAAKNCIILIKWCNKCVAYFDRNLRENLIRATEIAKAIQPGFINMSYGSFDDSGDEKRNLETMLENGTMISAAAGNEGNDFDKNCNKYPACYFRHKNFHLVGALFDKTTRRSYSNYGSRVNNWEVVLPNGGTSSAAAIHTNKLMRGLAK